MTYFFFVVKVNNFIFQLKNKKLVKVNKFEYLSRSTKLYSIIKINDFCLIENLELFFCKIKRFQVQRKKTSRDK